MLNPFGEYIFMKNGKRIKGQAFTRRLYVICDKVKIGERSIHKARKTYATKLIDGNVPESVIKHKWVILILEQRLIIIILIIKQRERCKNTLRKHYRCKR